jgi:Dolichyl-phosphate-mannose-protein mannosyltransferase
VIDPAGRIVGQRLIGKSAIGSPDDPIARFPTGRWPDLECGTSKARQLPDSRYISSVPGLLGEHRRFFLAATLAGLALRIFFLVQFPAVTDDSRIYLNLAGNWLQHGVYGQTQLGQIVPTDTRLPGYPAFLAGIFWIFGAGKIRAVLAAQMVLDMATCLLIADLARRTVRDSRAGRIAFALAASCPFLANYAAAVLTETLEIFLTALALDCVVAGLDRIGAAGKPAATWAWLASAGAAMGACILVRPDGGILLASVVAYLPAVTWRGRRGPLIAKGATSRASSASVAPASSGAPISHFVLAGIVIVAIALAPLVPWTMRNFRALHHFQPLAPRYANESDELAPRGFNRWVKTWMAEYTSVEEVYWNVPGDRIDVAKLPARALDEPAREGTLATIADYNQSQELTPDLDARFAELAAERTRAHPWRCYVELPVLRIADMWLRPRTEILPPDPRWWEFNDDRRESALAVGFGALNLAYVAAALLAAARDRRGLRYLGLLGGFLLLRSLFLGTIENPEPRYTLECYPVLLVWAAAFFAGKMQKRLSWC